MEHTVKKVGDLKKKKSHVASGGLYENVTLSAADALFGIFLYQGKTHAV